MKDERKMIEVEVSGNLDGDFSCFVYTSIEIPEDYSMNDVVRACARHGLKTFRFGNMKHIVEVPAWSRA